MFKIYIFKTSGERSNGRVTESAGFTRIEKCGSWGVTCPLREVYTRGMSPAHLHRFKKRNRTVKSIANISCTADNRTVIVCRVRLPRQIFTANRVITLFRIFRTVLAVRKDERNQLSGKLIRTNPERRRLLRASVSWSPNYRTTPERLSRAPTRWRPSYAHSRHE